MKNNKLLAILLSVLLVSFLAELYINQYAVVTDGKCYTFKNKFGWVNDKCFKTKEEAVEAMNDFNDLKTKEDEWESRDWQETN